MKNEEIQYYLEIIEKDLEELLNNRFTGNVSFKVNFKDGGIANMNCGLEKSVKKPIKKY